MIIATVISWVIMVLGLISFWVALRHPSGWLIGLLREMGFLAFGLITHEWAFAVAAILFGAVFSRNWLQDERRVKVTCKSCGTRMPKVSMRLHNAEWRCVDCHAVRYRPPKSGFKPNRESE